MLRSSLCRTVMIVIAGLVLLLSATSVVGTGGEWLRHWYIHRERHTRCWWRYYVATTGDADSTECVSQQDLAAVKAEMERKVDKLHSQFDYWQNVLLTFSKTSALPSIVVYNSYSLPVVYMSNESWLVQYVHECSLKYVLYRSISDARQTSCWFLHVPCTILQGHPALESIGTLLDPEHINGLCHIGVLPHVPSM